MPNTTIQRLDILESFKRLRSNKELLCAAISNADNELPLWNESHAELSPISTSDLQESRRALSKHIGQLWYQPDNALRLPGIIACSTNTIALLQAVNGQKAQFENLMVGLRKNLKAPGAKLAHLIKGAAGRRDEDIHQLLEATGMKGINLSLCYRRFQQLPHSIESVSWTWSMRSRSIKVLSIPEALDLANKRFAGSDVLDSIQAQLGILDPSESLALVKPVQPALKANIVFKDVEGRTVRKLVTAHSPLFYLDTGQGLPRLRWPGYPNPDDIPPRLSRSKRYIEDKVFIKALNLYRYL
tara:strand:- start:16094 stop:16990 length:897 start_codon:yes stop_codon:yes gene_type:complete